MENHLFKDVLDETDTRLPSLSSLPQSLPVHNSLQTTKTTIVAFAYRDGAVIAADRQTTFGFGEKHFETNKIYRVSNYSFLGAAGMVAYIQDLVRVFTRSIQGMKQFIEADVHIDGQARLLEYILKSNFAERHLLNVLLGYVAVPILAGWDPEEKRARIFSYDEAGAVYEATAGTCPYATVGSGGRPARIILDDRWQSDLEEIEAIRLAIRAVYRAGENDMGTSHGQLYPITVCLARKKGLLMIAEKDALDIAHLFFQEDMIRRKSPLRDKFFLESDKEDPS